MKGINLFLIITFQLTTTYLPAQDTVSSKLKRMRADNISFQAGGADQRNQPIETSDYRIFLAPQSALLAADFSSYNRSRTYPAWVSGRVYSAYIGLRFANKTRVRYRLHPLLRLGINYYSSLRFMNDLARKDQIRIDTLISSKGEVFYIDSIADHRTGMSYHSDKLSFEASFVYRTNPSKRVSFSGGIGVNGGFSFQANTVIYSTTTIKITEPRSSTDTLPGMHFYSDRIIDYSRTDEKFRNRNNVSGSIFSSVAIDFRIGRKNKFAI